MPAVNPRLNVSFQPSTYQTIKSISLLTGQSMSSVVGSMIESQSVVLSQVAEALSLARQIDRPVSGSMSVKLGFRENEVAVLEGQAVSALDDLLQDLRAEVGASVDRRALSSPVRGS